MATQAEIAELLRRMREMSAADISVLEASLNTPESSMTTAPGSRNQALWSKMEKLGWMTRRDEELEAGGRRLLMLIYSITSEGREPIARLLSALSQP